MIFNFFFIFKCRIKKRIQSRAKSREKLWDDKKKVMCAFQKWSNCIFHEFYLFNSISKYHVDIYGMELLMMQEKKVILPSVMSSCLSSDGCRGWNVSTPFTGKEK